MTKTLFNPFTREFRQNPYKTYASLQLAPPEFSLGMWIVTRHADVTAVLRDRRFSSSLVPQIAEKRLAEFALECPEVSELGRKSIVFTDNPDHARLRRLANLVFNIDAMNTKLKPMVNELASGLFDGIAAAGPVDMMAAVAEPLPLRTLTRWMGLPDESAEPIKRWTNEVRFFLEPGVIGKQRFQEIYRSLLEFMDFFRKEIGKRKLAPTTDFIGSLVDSRLPDDAFTEEEIIYACIMAFVAGSETTKAILGNAALMFARHRDQLQLLHDGAVSIQSAANELFRYESPLQMTKRICLEDVAVGGADIARGDQVLLCIGAANRDPNVFPEPDQLRLDRSNSGQHIAFGYGFHSCLGAHLAQLQIEAYLKEIVTRRITFTLEREPEWVEHTLILRGLKRLDVTVKMRLE